MDNSSDIIKLKAALLCNRPYLRPLEARLYTGLERTQFAEKCRQYGVYKNLAGYYKRSELDRMLSGEMPPI